VGRLGAVGRELSGTVVGDGFQPDPILAIARGGLLIAGAAAAQRRALREVAFDRAVRLRVASDREWIMSP
jgi:hypothetical protein